MGEIVGAGLLAHVPTIMLPERLRRELNNGVDSSLVSGLQRLRSEVFESLEYDTVVVVDSHWASTVEFLVASHPLRAGLHTSSELPRGMKRVPYEFQGDPELAEALGVQGEKHGTWITPIDDPYLPIYYGTVNLWTYLGVPGKRWLSISVCQTGDSEDFLTLGRALADAVSEIDRKVLIVASGALSHTFWPLREIREHEAAGVEHIFTPEAADADRKRVRWMQEGRHDRVLENMEEFLTYRPEARFAHYLTLVGALGAERCSAPGVLFSEYENSVGTGQVHVWFNRPAEGWTK